VVFTVRVRVSPTAPKYEEIANKILPQKKLTNLFNLLKN
jgi:hypothetical protein